MAFWRAPLVAAAGLAGAIAFQLGCASSGSIPDRGSVSDELMKRTGVDPRGLASPGTPTIPPGISLDDTLAPDEAVAIALWNNWAFQAALADLGVARADLTEARMLRNPILSLLFPWGPKQLEATLQLPADALWQRPRRVAAASSNIQAVGARLVNDGLALIAEVRRAYFEAAASDLRLALATENADLARRIAGIAEARLKAGDISELEARAARSDAAQFEITRNTLEHQRALTRVQLVALLGIEQDPEQLRLVAADALPVGECGSPPALIREALSSRPDVRAAEMAVEAAGSRASWERSRILNLIALLDANGQGREGFEMGPGIAPELPVFNQNQGPIGRAHAELDRASRQYLAVRTRVTSDVRSAYLRLSETQRALVLWDQRIVPELEIERNQAETAYTAGEASLLSVLDVGRRLVDARVRRLEASIAFQQAAVSLDYSVGRSCAVR